jgi:hypothetical protein
VRTRTRHIVNGFFYDDVPSSTDSSTYFGLPSDQADWNCTQWMEYYKRNVTSLGKEKAIFTVSTDMENMGAFSDLSWCKYDCNFMDYMRREGFPLESFFSDMFCTVQEAGEVVTGSTDTILKLVKAIAPIAIIGIAVYAGSKFIK